MRIRSAHRYLRLFVFAALLLAGAYLLANLLLAWDYVARLTHPGCPPLPEHFQPDREVTLKIPEGVHLSAWYTPPREGETILVLGGIHGARRGQIPPVDFLIQQGYGILQIDSRACARPVRPVTLGADEVQDALAGVDFLRSQPETRHIGALGFSMGAAAAIRAAAASIEIEAVAAEGGYFNLGKDITEPGTPQPFYQRMLLSSTAAAYWLQTGANPWQISPLDDLPHLSPRPVLLVYGEHEAASARAQAQYQAARVPKELWIVPGGHHGTNHLTAPAEYENRILKFFDQAFDEPLDTLSSGGTL